jgi:hypothetical protein
VCARSECTARAMRGSCAAPTEDKLKRAISSQGSRKSGARVGKNCDAGFYTTFTNCLPMFSPRSRPMKARGAFSSPCAMVSR